MDNIGKLIREIRKENGDTQAELGKKVGYSYGGIAKIEKGNRKASIELLEEIAKVYDVSVSHFLGTDQDIPKDLKEKGVEWVSFIDEMEKRELTPDELREVIEFMENFKK